MPARRLYLPPFAVILGMLGLGRASLPIADTATVPVPFGILRMLLRGALAAVPFHEERYLNRNPDVAAAVFRGELRSGHEHYVTNGYFEGRAGADEEFAEAWYLDSNADVALAVSAGVFASAQEHYAEAGMYELRGPNPRADEELTPWRLCATARPDPQPAPVNQLAEAMQDH